jgi:4-amino-4-deoxy-L-arabinose transferase-like glycosyltransferase
LTAIRLAVAGAAPLSPDEAYYWVWSRALAPGYLDHPPMVALWIWLGTALIGDGVLGVRLLGPLSALAGAWLLMRAGQDLLGDRRRGLIAALLLNATLLLGIGTVTMTPDTPLIFFWTLALFGLGRLLATCDGRWWGLIGAASGLALDSKYTAVLLPVGILLWLIWVPEMRGWLRRPGPWVAVLIALLVFAPVLGWNAGHDWVSFAKQGGRAADFQIGRAAQFLGELVLGQFGLATPVIAVLFALAMGRIPRGPARRLLFCLIWLPGLVFVQHAFGDRVQANWPAIMFPALALLASGIAPRWHMPGVALGIGLCAAVWVQAALAPLALPMRADPTLLRLGGWDALAGSVEAARARAHADFIVSDNYSHAALLGRLLPGSVLGLEPRWALFDLPDARAAIVGKAGVLVRSARRDDRLDMSDWAEAREIGRLDRARNGMVAESFVLYRVVGRAGATPLAEMPHPRR